MRNANFVITYKEYTPIAFKQNLYYLDIPLHAYYKQKIKNTTLIMFLGPSFNIGLDGSNYAQENTAIQKPIFNSMRQTLTVKSIRHRSALRRTAPCPPLHFRSLNIHVACLKVALKSQEWTFQSPVPVFPVR